MSLDKTLFVAQVAAPRCDAAFERGAPNTPAREAWMTAARRYVQTRAPGDLAKLPLKDGRKPRLYGVRVLTPEAFAVVEALSNVQQRVNLAVRAGVTSYRDENGILTDAPLENTGATGAPLATAAWLRTLQDLGGGQLLDELAAVVLRRYQIGDVEDPEGADPLDLYALPAGLRLGR